ncbi:MAG TPA: hypothetical protein VKY65_03015 [Alphaproteobacteria bacterium]|nr:hypothetical protein [Alphaproteobacteria bacterium]
MRRLALLLAVLAPLMVAAGCGRDQAATIFAKNPRAIGYTETTRACPVGELAC